MLIELVEKYGGRFKKKNATSKVDMDDVSTENWYNVWWMNNEKKTDVIITILEVAVSVLKGLKKLRGIFVKVKK